MSSKKNNPSPIVFYFRLGKKKKTHSHMEPYTFHKTSKPRSKSFPDLHASGTWERNGIAFLFPSAARWWGPYCGRHRGRPAWDMRAHTAWNTHASAAACGRHGGRPAWDTRAPTAAWNTHARAAAWDTDFAIEWMRGGRQRAYLRAEDWYLAACQKMPSQMQNCWRQVFFHFCKKTKNAKPV